MPQWKQISKFNESCWNHLSFNNTSKDNYWPTSTLSKFAKLSESIIYSQLNDYMENKFSKLLTGFRKIHNTQNSLLRMIQSWKAKLNNGSMVGVIIMELWKAFDSLNHHLLLGKLREYGLDNNTVSFMRSYLINRIQRFKINKSFREWVKIPAGVTQGSILGLVLLNVFINGIFSFL